MRRSLWGLCEEMPRDGGRIGEMVLGMRTVASLQPRLIPKLELLGLYFLRAVTIQAVTPESVPREGTSSRSIAAD